MARRLRATLVDAKRGFLEVVLWGVVGIIDFMIHGFNELARLDLLGCDVGGPGGGGGGGGARAARRCGRVEMLEIDVTQWGSSSTVGLGLCLGLVFLLLHALG